MLTLQSLTAVNFRSWKTLSFTFEKGLTVLLGANGAGKTSIRHAAQYALTGGVPNLRKQDLVRRGLGKNANFGVTVQCTIDGKPTTIRRGKDGTAVQQGGAEYSVRDASFMDRVKLAVSFAFLSAEQAHFVDVQEHKRKEMLTSLIAEVDFLRNRCIPYSKKILERLNDRRIKIGHDIDSMYILRDEIESSLATARETAADEKRRIDGLLSQAAVGLPMNADTYNGMVVERQNRSDDSAEKSLRIRQGNDWIQKAFGHNERCAGVQTDIQRTMSNTEVRRAELQGVEDMLQYAREALSCPACQGVMVCASCGKRIVTGEEKEATLLKKKAQILADITHNEAALVELQAKVAGKLQPVPAEEIERIRATIQQYEIDVDVHRKAIALMDSDIHEYDISLARSQEILKVTEHQEYLQRLYANIRTIEIRYAETATIIKRKTKSLEVVEARMGHFRQANIVMNEIMPSVYFNIFLSRLNEFCNFLLSQISTMRLELGANEDGITITVDGKEVKQLSSGERQRVRIATTLAFSLMAPGTDTLFIDEVFDAGLDNEGVQALALLLSTHMKSFFRNIIMISHQPALSAAIGADRVINIYVDGDNVSALQQTFAKEVA